MLQVSEQGARQDAFVDVEPLDWEQYRKYDVFHQLLKAAAASPTAQVPAEVDLGMVYNKGMCG